MVVDLFLVYQFIRRLATPFDKWPAYEAGVIDKDGNIIKGKKERNTRAEKESFGIFDLMILKLKKLLAKVPGGSSRLASYAAALWLIKEWKHFSEESILNESVSEDILDESLDLFFSRYCYYINLAENVNGLNEAVADKPPRWKRAGPNGELEIKFPTGRRFIIEKQLDHNDRHKGEWMVKEWMKGDWEWVETYSPKWYAKEMVMRMGQYDKRRKKVADYSSTFQSESTQYDLEEEPTVNVGSGAIAGLGVGPQGEPGLTMAQMKRYKKKNKGPKRLRDIIGAKV